MWNLNVELASCHPSDTQILEVVPRVLENLCTPALQDSEQIDLHSYVDKSLNMLKK